MKSPFRSDPTVALQSALERLAATEADSLATEGKLAGLLAGDDDLNLAEAKNLRKQITEARGDAAVLRDRIISLRSKVREADLTKRAEEKIAAVADIGKRTARRDERAQRVDDAIRVIATELPLLLEADAAIYRGWSDTLPDANLYAYTSASTIRELSSRPPQTPLHAGIVRALANHGDYGFADILKENGRELIEELRRAAIPDTRIDTEAA
jgi:hypothetical protein